MRSSFRAPWREERWNYCETNHLRVIVLVGRAQAANVRFYEH